MNNTSITAPHSPPGKKSWIDSYVNWFMRWMPDSMAVILLITIVLAIVVKLFCGSPIVFDTPEKTSLINAWTRGFWNLLSFSAQMTLVMVTGYIVSNVGIIKKGMIRLARLPKSEFQAFLMTLVVSSVMSYIHWGLGTMAGVVLAQQVLAQAKGRFKIHMPLFLGMLVMRAAYASHGLSQAAGLLAATPGALAEYVTEEYAAQIPVVPLTETVLTARTIGTILFLMLITIGFYFLLRPKTQDSYEEITDAERDEILHVGQDDQDMPKEKTFANFMNYSPFLTVVIGGAGLLWVSMSIAKTGIIGLSINTFNFLMLMVGIILSGSPQRFAHLATDAMKTVWAVVVQFPLYAGLFGLINYTGFSHLLTDWFLSFATPATYPLIIFLYSAVVNVFVPSGGSKLVIELPYILPVGLELGVPLWKVIVAYTWGDLTTNIIQPFWLLPIITLFKTKFAKLMPYGLMFASVAIVIHSILFLTIY